MRAIRVLLCAVFVSLALAPAGAGERSRGGYVFAFGETSHATNADLDQFVRIRNDRSGDFLWFRRDGRSYIVTDPATLAVGRDILRPIRDLGREQQAVSDRLAPFEEREEAIDREEEALDEAADRLDDREDRAASEERARLEERQRALEVRRRALEAGMREIKAEERLLEGREKEIERMADEKVERLIEDVWRRGLARRLP